MMGYTQYGNQQYRWRPQNAQRGTTSSFGNTSGLGSYLGGGNNGMLDMSTSMGMNSYPGGGGGNDPTSTADVNRPTYGSGQGAGSGSTASNTNNQPGSQQQTRGSGQTSPNPDPYGQPWVDYINADGSPHINYQYGNPYHHTGNSGGGGGGQTSGEGVPGYWQGLMPQNQPPKPMNTIPVQVGTDSNGIPIYNNPYGQTSGEGSYGGQQQYPGMQQNYGLPFDWAGWAGATPADQQTAQGYAATLLPFMQHGQNVYTDNRDFNAMENRYWAGFGEEVANNVFNRNFADRQQGAAEQQQQYAQLLGRDQFNHTQNMDYRNFGLQEQAADLQAELGRGDLAERIRASLAGEGLRGRELDIATNRLMQEGNQFYAKLAQEGNQFESQLGFDKYRNEQQYGLQKGSLAENIRAAKVAEGFRGQELELEVQKEINRTNQFNRQMSQEEKLAGNELAYKYAGLGQEGAIARERMGLDERLANQDVGYRYSALNQEGDLSREQMGLQRELSGAEIDLARWRTGQELGFNREELQADTSYKYANLQQQARQVAAQQGIDLQQVQNTAWYQQQQAAIAREQMGQETMLTRERMAQENALTRWRTEQELAASRENTAMQAFGRSMMPNTRWLRVG